ncbi:hypothetical protein BD779DRAFT_976286 [Infundibulicybe gibba]|nr:hypothetical protein BD779DRAFT_976286 [Infundibulicybe gibba]
MPPPVYTPRATENSTSEPSTPSAVTPDTLGEQELTPHSNVAPEMRPVGYGLTKVTDQEVNSFAYQPPAKRTQKRQQKHDRMLLLFWLPILLSKHYFYSGLPQLTPLKFLCFGVPSRVEIHLP